MAELYTKTSSGVERIDVSVPKIEERVTNLENNKLSKTEKASSALVADSATKATQDSLGNIIHDTYALKSDSSNISLLDVYPVGSIYLSISSTSPDSLFGGTWEKLQNVFLYASGSKTVGNTGGSETVTLNVNQIPAHNHTGSASSVGTHNHGITSKIYVKGGRSYPGTTNDSGYTTNYLNADGAHSHILNIDNTGGNQSHDNMPPYLVVNMWKRIS